MLFGNSEDPPVDNWPNVFDDGPIEEIEKIIRKHDETLPKEKEIAALANAKGATSETITPSAVAAENEGNSNDSPSMNCYVTGDKAKYIALSPSSVLAVANAKGATSETVTPAAAAA